MSDVSERFARNLKCLRLRKGHNQDVMAASLDLKRTTYVGYETGASQPSLETLHAMQEKFGVGADLMLRADLYLLTEWQWHQLKSTAGLRSIQHARPA